MKPELAEIARQSLSRCGWCGKDLEDGAKYPVGWYHCLTLDETVAAVAFSEYGGGRFCSWDHLVEWVQHRAEKEKG